MEYKIKHIYNRGWGTMSWVIVRTDTGAEVRHGSTRAEIREALADLKQWGPMPASEGFDPAR